MGPRIEVKAVGEWLYVSDRITVALCGRTEQFARAPAHEAGGHSHEILLDSF